jgi:hypothetical protein
METVMKCQLQHKGESKVQQSALWLHSQIMQHSNTTAADFAFGGFDDQGAAYLFGLMLQSGVGIE